MAKVNDSDLGLEYLIRERIVKQAAIWRELVSIV